MVTAGFTCEGAAGSNLDNPSGRAACTTTRSTSRDARVCGSPAWEWNRFHIIMRGERVTVYLNDELVVDDVRWKTTGARQADPPMGPIELQNHGSVLKFRNIFCEGTGRSDAAEQIRTSGWRVRDAGSACLSTGVVFDPAGEWNGKVYDSASEWLMHEAKIRRRL